MKIISKLDYNKFLTFAKSMNQHHIFHSIEWAKFRQKSYWNYEFIGVEEAGELKMACLVLTKPLPKTKKLFAHIPRGFVMNYNDTKLLEEITHLLKDYLKKQKVFAFRIDPDIILHEIDRQKNIIEGGQNNYELVQNLKKIGYKHQGYPDNFEGMFPRLTFRNYLDKKSIDTMYEELYYKTRTNIKTAMDKGIEVQYATVDEIDDFIALLREKAQRDGILGQSKEYFENLLNVLNQENPGSATLCFTFLNTKKYLETATALEIEIQKEYDELEAKKSEENMSAKRLKKIENKQKNLLPKLKKAKAEVGKACEAHASYPHGLRLTGSIYVVHQNRAWFLFTGSSEKYRETMPAYLNLWQMIKTLKEKNIEYLDLFGASGNIKEDSPHFGIYLFKNRFNGTFMEFIGEFDYVIDGKYYFLYNKVAPKVQTSKDSKTLRFLLKIIKK